MHHHSSTCNHHHVEFSSSNQPKKMHLLLTVLALIGVFAGIELTVSYFSHSLALLADSGHLLSDCLALGLSAGAAWLSQIPDQQAWEANQIVTRASAGLIAALINGIGLVVVAAWIAWEAIVRLESPPMEIFSLPMLITAIAGLAINSFSIVILHKDSHEDLNLRGAFLHVLADAISSVGVIMAAIAIQVMHWLWADGVVSLCVATLIMLSAIPLIFQSSQALLAPKIAN